MTITAMVMATATTMESTMTINRPAGRPHPRPRTQGAGGITLALLVGGVLATLAGAHLLVRQDQPASAMAGQPSVPPRATLVVPPVQGADGVILDLPPIPTVAPAPLTVRPVARTRSSR